MLNKVRNFFKTFDEKILSKEEEKPEMNFKGQRFRRGFRQGAPNPTREQFEYNFKLDPEIKPQTRKVRFMNMGYGLAFLAWYFGAVYFIMYRLRSDDLETLEKEAEERIKLKKMVQENIKESAVKKY